MMSEAEGRATEVAGRAHPEHRGHATVAPSPTAPPENISREIPRYDTTFVPLHFRKLVLRRILGIEKMKNQKSEYKEWGRIRLLARLRRDQVASLAGMPARRYAAIERGSVVPLSDERAAIKRALNQEALLLPVGISQESAANRHIFDADIFYGRQAATAVAAQGA